METFGGKQGYPRMRMQNTASCMRAKKARRSFTGNRLNATVSSVVWTQSKVNELKSASNRQDHGCKQGRSTDVASESYAKACKLCCNRRKLKRCKRKLLQVDSFSGNVKSSAADSEHTPHPFSHT